MLLYRIENGQACTQLVNETNGKCDVVAQSPVAPIAATTSACDLVRIFQPYIPNPVVSVYHDKEANRIHVTCNELPFIIGQLVRVIASAFVTARTGRINAISMNELGTVCYWLNEGGIFSANELKAI